MQSLQTATVGPVWHGGQSGEEAQLSACYRSSLDLARRHNFSSIAFPLLSVSNYDYPPHRALSVATAAISDWLAKTDCDMTVYLVLFDRAAFLAGSEIRRKIHSYIDDHYVDSHLIRCCSPAEEAFSICPADCAPVAYKEAEQNLHPPCSQAPHPHRPEDPLAQVNENFSQMLFRLICERELTDPEVCRRANLSRRLFSKIRSDPHYQPGKGAVLALAIALELNLDQATDLLNRAGFALSPSIKADLIIEFCLREGIYGIHTVNEILFEFNQKTLGAQ